MVLHALVTVETAEKLTSGKNVWEAMGKLINQHGVLFMKSTRGTTLHRDRTHPGTAHATRQANASRQADVSRQADASRQANATRQYNAIRQFNDFRQDDVIRQANAIRQFNDFRQNNVIRQATLLDKLLYYMRLHFYIY